MAAKIAMSCTDIAGRVKGSTQSFKRWTPKSESLSKILGKTKELLIPAALVLILNSCGAIFQIQTKGGGKTDPFLERYVNHPSVTPSRGGQLPPLTAPRVMPGGDGTIRDPFVMEVPIPVRGQVGNEVFSTLEGIRIFGRTRTTINFQVRFIGVRQVTNAQHPALRQIAQEMNVAARPSIRSYYENRQRRTDEQGIEVAMRCPSRVWVDILTQAAHNNPTISRYLFPPTP